MAHRQLPLDLAQLRAHAGVAEQHPQLQPPDEEPDAEQEKPPDTPPPPPTTTPLPAELRARAPPVTAEQMEPLLLPE